MNGNNKTETFSETEKRTLINLLNCETDNPSYSSEYRREISDLIEKIQKM